MATKKKPDEFYLSKPVLVPRYAGLGNEQLSVQKAIELAGFHADSGSLVYAISVLEAVVRSHPKYARPYYGLVSSWLKKGNKKVARQWLDKLIAMPADVELLLHASHAYAQLYDNAGYAQCLEKAIRFAPKNPRVLLDYARLMIVQGRDAEANRCLLAAISIDRQAAQAYAILVEQDPALLTDSMLVQLQKLASESAPSQEQHVYANMALAMMARKHNDIGKEFAYISAAKKPLFEKRRWDFSVEKTQWQEVEDLFSSDWASERLKESLVGQNNESFVPIILSTLPRSGTTLLDKVLSTHSMVQSVEESGLFAGPAMELASEMHFRSASACFRNTDYSEYRFRYRESVLQSYSAMQLTANFITDKSLYNYRNIGLILMMFPNAKIIHCSRDYRDICLSCYQYYFPRGNPATLDLVSIAQLCSIYDRAMLFWKRIFPDRIREVKYENIVNDTETELRKVIEFCGLPWEDACLKHHESKKHVHTASVKQVMEPINSKGLGRWRKYENVLQPAIEELQRNGLCEA